MCPTNPDRLTASGLTRLDETVPDVPQRIYLSVLIPVKDEVDSLKQLTAELTEVLADVVVSGMRSPDWELIFIDDGSTDGSWERIVELAAQDVRVKGLRFRRNLGKSAALAAGLEASSGEIIATMDGDLQDDPSELPKMISRLDDPADLVAGHKTRRQDPRGKRVASRLFNFFTSLMTGLKLQDHNCGLKVGRREVFMAVPLYGEMHRFFAAMSHAHGFRVVEQPVNHRARQFGSSKFGMERYVRGGLDLLTVITLTRYNRRPAHLLGGIGLALGFIGGAILLYLSGVWFFTDQPIGSRPLLLMGVLFVLVAVQLTSLGLLAELILNRAVTDEDPLTHVTDRANS